MRVIYFAHPLGAPTPEGVTANIARAKRWVRWIYDNFPDVAVVADWLITVEVLDDFNPEHRKHGMEMNKAIIPCCKEFWMCGGRVSNGMQDESVVAIAAQLRIFDLTWIGNEPPLLVPEKLRAILT